MATNAAMISRVRSSFKINSADSSLTDRAILAELHSVALKYIKQQTDKRKLWDSPNLFTPLRIDFEEVPIADYCDYQSDCTIARSKFRLPKIAEGVFGLLHQGLYTLKKDRKFIEMSASRYVSYLNLGLPNRDICYWFFDGYICASLPTLQMAILPALVEGEIPPEFEMDCKDENDCPTNPLDGMFRCPGYLEEDVITAVASFYSSTFKRSIEDSSSDDKDESK